MSDTPDGYEPAAGQSERYPESYFITRQANDPQRLRQFELDAEFMRRFMEFTGPICDIGCSTGEFLSRVEWSGDRFGVEISPYARELAKRNGVRFDKDIFSETGFFDVVVFRGTIQHVDEPFRFMKAAFKALRPGGHIVFLATPNMNSLLYRTKETLPFLVPHLNFYVPDDKNLPNALRNYGFVPVAVEYPYFNSPYRSLVSDHLNYVRNCLSRRFFPHAFWKSSMNLIARKRSPGERAT